VLEELFLWCEVVDIYNIKGQLFKIIENDAIIVYMFKSPTMQNTDSVKQDGTFTNQKRACNWPQLNCHISLHFFSHRNHREHISIPTLLYATHFIPI
jgi:hypothetical protein